MTSILGKSSAWSFESFQPIAQLENLQSRSFVKSYCFVPERLRSLVDPEVKAITFEPDSKSAVEVVVRVDVSEWLDTDKLN